jgi:hypothetical protein
MANPLAHAQNSHTTMEKEVKPYVSGLFPRLALNYGLLLFVAVLVSTIAVPTLGLWIPQSTASVLGFSINFLMLFFGWRFFEKRNKATSLYILYTSYSRQRRDLEALMKQAEAKSLSNMDALYTSVDKFEEAAKAFLSAAQEAGIEAKV